MAEPNGQALTPIVLVGLNELNLEYVEHYIAQGKLPGFRQLLDQHGYITTKSEIDYQELEPWIQWVTIHSGLPLSDHGVFRLGDILESKVVQIWEDLEQTYGCKVAAVSPMNAANRARQPAFFLPDPWTPTEITGPRLLHGVSRAISQAVNENATGARSPAVYLWLLAALARYTPAREYPARAALIGRAMKKKYVRAILLDHLLTDVFLGLWRRHRPDFASLFLNSAAHIQHHYMFSSAAYRGPNRNPAWYAEPGSDPVCEVYDAYDQILGRLRRQMPRVRLVLATGLHQVPVRRPVYYYRLKHHDEFLRTIEAPFAEVQTRMSRDFLVVGADAGAAQRCADRLLSCTDARGEPLFEIDNRGTSLFVTLIYPHEITPGFTVYFEAGEVHGFEEQVAFVALKNGEHDGNGYLIDTGAPAAASSRTMPLTDVFALIKGHFQEQARSRARRPAEPVPTAV